MEYLTTPDSARRWNLPTTTPGTGTATALVPGANRQAHIRDSFQSLFSPSLDLPPLASTGTIIPSPSLLGPRFTAPTPLLSAALTIGPGGGSAALCPPSGTPGGNGSAIVAAAAAAAAAAAGTVPVAPGADVPPSPARPDAVMSSPFLRQAAKDAVVREFHNTCLGDGTVTGGHLRFGGMASPAWNILLPSTPGVGRPPPVPTPGARPHGAGLALPQGAAGAPKRKAPAPEPTAALAAPAAAASPVKDEGAARSAAESTKPPAPPARALPEPSKTVSVGEASSTAPTVDVSQVATGSSTSRIPADGGGATPEADAKLAVTAPVSMAMPNLPAPYAAMMYGGPSLGMYMPSASMAAQMQFQHWQQMYQQSASVGMFPTVSNPLVPPRPGQYPATLAAAAVPVAPPVKETAEERKSREETEKETLTREFKKKTREAALLRFRQKRRDRKFGKLVRYTVRKALADGRPRVKGRFVKMPDDMPGGSSASAPMDSSDSGGGSPSMTSADAGSLPRRAQPQPLPPPPPPGRGKPPCTPVSSG